MNILKEFKSLKEKERELSRLDMEIMLKILEIKKTRSDLVEITVKSLDINTKKIIKIAKVVRMETRAKRTLLNKMLNEQKKNVIQKKIISMSTIKKEDLDNLPKWSLPYVHYIKLSKYKNRAIFKGSFSRYWISKKENSYFAKGYSEISSLGNLK